MFKSLLVFLALLFGVTVEGLIVCSSSQTNDCIEVAQTESTFSPALPHSPRDGLKSELFYVDSNLCDDGPTYLIHENSILIAQRGDCSFKEKALNAEKFGASALVIFDNAPNEEFIIMGSAEDGSENKTEVTIPVVFITKQSGLLVLKYMSESAHSGDKTYGLLFSADDVQNYFGYLAIIPRITCILIILLLVLLLQRCFRYFCFSRPDRKYIVVEDDSSDSRQEELIRGTVAPAQLIVVGVPVISKTQNTLV